MGTIMGLESLRDMFRPPEPEDDTEALQAGFEQLGDTTELPAIQAAGPVSFWRQVIGAAGHTWRAARHAARESHERDGSFLQQQKAVEYSYDGLCEYADSRAWVPDGHAGGLFERLGDLYFMIGKRKAAYHLAQLYKCWRPLRQCVWWITKYLVLVGFLLLTHRAEIAVLITGVLLAVVAIAVIVAMPRRSAPEVTETAPDNEGEAGDLS